MEYLLVQTAKKTIVLYFLIFLFREGELLTNSLVERKSSIRGWKIFATVNPCRKSNDIFGGLNTEAHVIQRFFRQI